MEKAVKGSNCAENEIEWNRSGYQQAYIQLNLPELQQR